MVYGQSAAWYALQGGHKNIGNIIDHCAHFVFDVAAEFIIKEGGWVRTVVYVQVLPSVAKNRQAV